jgi:hypothetical protein
MVVVNRDLNDVEETRYLFMTLRDELVIVLNIFVYLVPSIANFSIQIKQTG